MSTAPHFERSKSLNLSTIFELSLYAMIALSSVMLMISEGTSQGLPPQTFTPLFLIGAYLIVDRWRMWFLPWWAAGVLGLVALVVSFVEVPQYLQFEHGLPVLPDERRLDLIFAGAHLLVFLTWIILFLEKRNQQYGWLWALCVLQIAVGASQSTESLYGILLSAYLFLAVWTLSVFSLLQGQQQFDRAQQIAESTHAWEDHPTPSEAEPPGPSAPQSKTMSPTRSERWLGLWRQPSNAVGNVQRDPTDSWINPRFFGGVVGTAGLAFVLALVFFFLIPRHPSIWRRGSVPVENKSTVGFSRNLSLGDIGQILESTKKVLAVRLTDFQTGDSLDIEKYAFDMGYEEPLFRGMTTVEYEGGQWRTWESDDLWGGGDRRLRGLRSPRGEFVKQHIQLEEVDSELLFAMPPARYGEIENSREAIAVEPLTGILKRPPPNNPGETTTYAILSPKELEHPGALPLLSVEAFYLRHRLRFYQRVPRELEMLRGLALEKSGLKESPQPSPMEMARRLENYLKTSGEYRYTLNANVVDPGIDPLEDFLVNRKVGHCEYFASALTLMLRCVGIPSRLVSGFKGGEYNQNTELFEVEERHAHAWVEAYIDQSWVILDPTPASRAESVASLAATPGRLTDVRNHLRDFWRRFVVHLNVTEQRRLLAPLKQLMSEAINWLKNGREHFGSFVKGLQQQLKSPERWISWQGGLVTFVLLTALSGVVWLLLALGRLFVRLRSQYFAPQGLARTVAFYERFRRDCSAAGLTRKASQTPQEFAVAVREHFSPLFETTDWGQFPLSLIHAYYDVRYGAQELNGQRLHDLEIQLTRFESYLTPPPNPK